MCGVYNFVTGDVLRFLPFSPKTVFFLPQKSFITDGTLRQQVTLNSLETTLGIVSVVFWCTFVKLWVSHAFVNWESNSCYLEGRENMQPVPRAGKHVTGAKRGKACNRCQTRENMQPVPNAGKHAIGAKRGKTCNRCQAWENALRLSHGR